jgi:hypothetical protein
VTAFALFAAAIQAVSASPPDRVDLTIPQPCADKRKENGEVVVCANRKGVSPYRLQEPAAPPEKGALPKAEVEVAEGVTAGVATEQADVGGFPSNRVKVGVKIKF